MKQLAMRYAGLPLAVGLVLTAATPVNADNTAVRDCSATGSLAGAGSSAQGVALTSAIESFRKECPNVAVTYTTSGSGAGIKAFNDGSVDFAGSDSALNADKGEVAGAAKRCGAPALHLPLVSSTVVFAYNVPGVGSLNLPSAVVTQILMGTITSWNDARIAAANPGVALPALAISVIHRADQSGTTENVEKYLAAVSPQVFTSKPDKVWSGVGTGKDGSAGVAAAVKATPGSVTYVEAAVARDAGLNAAAVDNGAGPVAPTAESGSKALQAAKKVSAGHDIVLAIDYATKAPGAYPLVQVTYEIVCSKGLAAQKTQALTAFLGHLAADTTQAAFTKAGYTPVPASLLNDVRASVASITP